MSIINGVSSEYEMPPVPKFYPYDNSIPGVYTAKLRYVARRDNARYVAKDDGIYLCYDEIDNHEEIIRTIEEPVLSKDVFVAAYNAYIKGDK